MKATSSNYWLIKSEPTSRLESGKDIKFSIEDLERVGTSSWEGIRNYEARNLIRDKIKVDDICLFYHSNCKIPGIAGLARVVKEAYPDHYAFNKEHPYYDPKSDPENPKWFMFDVEFERKLNRYISLDELKKYKDKELKDMVLLKRGRLSVQPVDKQSFEFILKLENIDE